MRAYELKTTGVVAELPDLIIRSASPDRAKRGTLFSRRNVQKASPGCNVPAALAAVFLFTLSACAQDKEGIFKDINEEIELTSAVAKGNIFDIVSVNGKLFAGGGKVYVKDNPSAKASWRVFSDSPMADGVVVRMAAGGGGITVKCAKTVGGETTDATYTSSALSPSWKLGGTIPPRAATYTVAGIGTVTCETELTPKYYGTVSGIKAADGRPIPGSNYASTVGQYRISAIYAAEGHIYVGAITNNGTKNNGIWAYHGDTWDRE